MIFLEKRPGRILKILTGISLVSLIVISTTSLGFPYSADPAAPKPQRYMFVVRKNYLISVFSQTHFHSTQKEFTITIAELKQTVRVVIG